MRNVVVVLVLCVAALAVLLALSERDRSTLARPDAASSVERAGAELVDPGEAQARERTSAVVADAPTSPQRERDEDGVPPEGATLRLRVVDELDGRPVAGARVALEGDADLRVTDADGWCELGGLDGSSRPGLSIDADGYYHERTRVPLADERVVRLYPATTLVGRVLDDASGAPVAGAQLSFRHPGCGDCEPERATSDALGRYALANVPIAVHVDVRLSAADHAAGLVEMLVPRRTERVERDLRLRRGVRLVGRVVDFVTGAPIANAQLRHVRHEPVELGPDGAFDVPVLAGDVFLEAWADGWCRLNVELTTDELARSGPLVLRLPRGAFVEGVVHDAEGRPVAGVDVEVRGNPVELQQMRRRDDAPEWLAMLESDWYLGPERFDTGAVTDEQGRFRSRANVPGAEHVEIFARHATLGRARQLVPSLGGPGSTTWVDVRLEPLEPAEPVATVCGRLTLNGRECAAQIEWQGPTRTELVHVNMYDGRYRLAGVEPGAVTVHARFGLLYEQRWVVERSAQLLVEPGGAHQLDFDVRVPAAPISGRVTFADGSPAPTVAVVLHDASLSAHTSTEHDGTYALDAVDVGETYTVRASDGPFDLERNDVAPGTSGVDFVLPLTGELLYRIVDAANGEPLPVFALFWRTDATAEYVETHRRTPDPGGWMRLELPAGRVDVHLRATDERYAPLVELGLPIPVRGETRRTFELEHGLVARFTWADEPLWSHNVLLVETHVPAEIGPHFPGGSLRRRVMRFEDGVAEVAGLEPGSYRFVLEPDDDAVAIEPAVVEIGANVDAPIELSWSER